MKFEIEGEDKEKIKEVLKKFIEMSREEYEKEKPKIRNASLPPEIDFGYYEEGDKIIFFNSMPLPKMRVLNVVLRPMVKKAEKNLKGFFEAHGLNVKVRFVE